MNINAVIYIAHTTVLVKPMPSISKAGVIRLPVRSMQNGICISGVIPTFPFYDNYSGLLIFYGIISPVFICDIVKGNDSVFQEAAPFKLHRRRSHVAFCSGRPFTDFNDWSKVGGT